MFDNIHKNNKKPHASDIFFFDLVPLTNKDSDTVFQTILDSLKSQGISEQKLSNDLIELCSESASTFTGKKSGVGDFSKQIP